MDIFIYSGSSETSVQFKKIVVALSQRGNIIVNQNLIERATRGEHIDDTQKYELTLSALKKATLCIFESSAPHFYDGFFLSLALNRKLTSIICTNSTANSNYIEGCTNPLCYVRHYRDLKDLIYQLAVFGV